MIGLFGFGVKGKNVTESRVWKSEVGGRRLAQPLVADAARLIENETWMGINTDSDFVPLWGRRGRGYQG